MEDAEIIEMYWKRDEAAITESNIKYGRMLKHIAFNILSNHEDSEECVNDTYGKVWETVPPKRPNSLAAYMGRIIRNLSINRWYENRTQKRGNGAAVLLSELSDCIPSQDFVESDIEADSLTEIINAWLSTLPQDDRVLFLRRYWYGDDLNMLAFECSVSPNKMAGRIYRLRRKLKTILEGEGVSV